MQLKRLKKIRFILMYNRKGQLNEDGTALVQVRAYQKGKNRYFSTGIYIEPCYWDERNKRIRETHPLEVPYNRHLMEVMQSLKDFEVAAIQRYGTCPLKLFDNFGKEEETTPDNFGQFCLEELARPEIAPNTQRKHRYSIGLLLEFQKEVHFDELTPSFVARYDRFLHRRGLALNTIDSHHRVLKSYINRAILFDHIPADSNPYAKFKSRTEEPKRVFLSQAELKQLEDLKLPKDKIHLEKIRRVFLLSCYLGLRFGDVTRLSARHLEETAKGMQINIKTEKNGKILTLPVWLLFRQGRTDWSKPESIIRQALKEQPAHYRRASLNGQPFFRMSNPYLNRGLKEVARLAGIKKHLTHHVARRTFATLMSTRVKTPVLQRLLNHSKIDITMIYVRMSNSLIEEELEKIDWKK